ncbi:LysR family transcriptional regulator [Altererythrobacter sp. KTW20L]|uniref:LysR family transcriptional regulator n=1 Tax=Altererythrobacter sp. KTW20L TaxID=2942210 RepID=UPI0020BFD690|nr:LysR family transcriptional regulator [Altererythrobacter sp. KTW20L]MCL6251633.1 LysR family transcriptional regulator [Altererythrobacter sp. KTW20L]
MNITFRQLRYFIAVAEARSVSGGSSAVGISQSAVTDAIRTLELETGMTLFNRHAKGVTLTREGSQFLRNARSIVDAIAGLAAGAGPGEDQTEGRIRIGATPLVTGYFFADLLSHFQRLYPRIEVSLVEDKRSYIEHMLVGGELDLALLLVANLEQRHAIDYEVLLRSECRAWMAPTHPLANVDGLSLAQMENDPVVMLALDELEGLVEGMWAKFDHPPRVAFRTSSVEGVRSLVGTGAGITLMPDLVYRPWSLEGDRILSKRTRESLPTVDIGIGWRRLSRHSEAVSLFLETAQNHRR